jgi:ribosomal protein L16 Arg81 hydroxylase
MFLEWLEELSPEAFLAEHFQRAPLAQPRAARNAISLFTWETLARIVTTLPRPEIMVAKSGKLLRERRPESGADIQQLFDDGCSLVIRKAEEHDEGLRWLADSFAAAWNAPATIQLFATPAGHHGFGWHYDCEDVFLAQTAGLKEYFLRRNSVNPEPRIDAMPVDMHYEQETTPVMACTLAPGDWLYIPSGWWHVGRSEQHSLGISVGVLSERARG